MGRVARMRLNVTLYVHCLSLVNKNSHSLCRVTWRLPHSSGIQVTIHTKNYHCIIGPSVGMFVRQFVTCLSFSWKTNENLSCLWKHHMISIPFRCSCIVIKSY